MGSKPLFNSYITVDWSGAGSPKLGQDSIWYCHVKRGQGNDELKEVTIKNVSTRKEAAREIMKVCCENGTVENILVGWDFSFSFPRGLAKALLNTKAGSKRDGTWISLWEKVVEAVVDADDNSNNRFKVAADMNQAISGRNYPFWGCPKSKASAYLSCKKPRAEVPGVYLPQLRMVESRCNAQSTFKLFTPGSVGSQTILGIPYLHELRFHEELEKTLRIWPFETGFSLRLLEDGRIQTDHEIFEQCTIFAEVYPSLVNPDCRLGEPKDAGQVRALAWHFATMDSEGKLGDIFKGPQAELETSRELPKPKKQKLMITPLSTEDIDIVLKEEGWILGVT